MSAIIAASYVEAAGGALVQDSFDRANGAIGTADSGQTWSVLSGNWTVESNKARNTFGGTQSFCVIDAGIADCTLEVTVSGTLNSGGGIAFRFTDANNGLFIEIANGSQTVIYKLQGGGFTQLSIISMSWAAGDVMTVVLSGTSITLKKNGVVAGSTTSSFNQTATKHGLRDFGAVIRFDDFSCAA